MARQDDRFPLARSEIAGVPVAELASEFGTPTYVYDAARIEAQIARLGAFDTIRYAQKANSNLAILDLCRRHGVVVDAVSAGEIHRARKAGYAATGQPAPIVYTADVFDRPSLERVVAEGIAVNCGSPDMIDQYGERVPGGEITLRINPGFGHGHSQKNEHRWSAVEARHLARGPRRLPDPGREIRPSGDWSSRPHRVRGRHGALDAGRRSDLEPGTSHRPQRTPTLPQEEVFPSPTERKTPKSIWTAYFEIWDHHRRSLEEDFGHPVELEIEPGRFLVAEAGSLICEIRAIKQTRKHTFYLVDAGFNNLVRPVLYGAYHPISLGISPDQAAERDEREVVVGGALCESGDVFTQDEGGFVRTQTHARCPGRRSRLDRVARVPTDS